MRIEPAIDEQHITPESPKPAEEETIPGFPLGEEVPDEKEVPAEQLEQQGPSLFDIPEQVALEGSGSEIPEGKPKQQRAKRGSYKKKNKGEAIIKSSPSGFSEPTKVLKYISVSTAEAVRNGKDMHLPGIQATPKKFIVGGAYFKGMLDEARFKYKKYLDKGIKEFDEILTWESWLTSVFAKDQQPERKIDGDK